MSNSFSQYQRSSLSTYKYCSIVIFAVSYGVYLASLPIPGFADFTNYLNYAKNSIEIWNHYLSIGLTALLFNEPIWLLLNSRLSIFYDPDTVVRIIVFSSASSISFLLLSRYPSQFIFIIIFLFSPQVIKNLLVHIRQGAGTAVFLWGFYSPNRFTRSSLIAVAPFIHSSFFFILVIYLFSRLLARVSLSVGVKVSISIFSALVLVFSMNYFAQISAARQIDTLTYGQISVSGFGFIFWLAIFLLMLSAGKRWCSRYLFELTILALYLMMYWFNIYSARVFDSGILPLMISGLMLAGLRRQAFLFMVITFCASFWVSRIGQPYFGFLVN